MASRLKWFWAWSKQGVPAFWKTIACGMHADAAACIHPQIMVNLNHSWSACLASFWPSGTRRRGGQLTAAWQHGEDVQPLIKAPECDEVLAEAISKAPASGPLRAAQVLSKRYVCFFLCATCGCRWSLNAACLPLEAQTEGFYKEHVVMSFKNPARDVLVDLRAP